MEAPEGNDGEKNHEHDQGQESARTEGPRDKDNESDKGPDGNPVRQGHQPEEPGDKAEPDHRALLGLPGLDRLVEEIEDEREKEKHEHLRQAGLGEFPQEFAEQHEQGGHAPDLGVEDPADQHVADPDGAEEEENGDPGNHAVQVVDLGVLRSLPVVLSAEELQHQRIQERIERGVVGVVELDHSLARHTVGGIRMIVGLVEARRTHAFRREALRPRHLARDLCLLDPLRTRQAGEVQHQIK